jgi:hypothetical protein
MTERIGILIDLEGMGHLYRSDEFRFFTSVDCLLSNGIRLANICSEGGNNRYFLHQMGADGFLAVTSHGYKSTIDQPVSFSIVLLQILLLNNAIGKCGIAQGDFGDIQGCLPETEAVQEHFSHEIRPSTFMTRLNVMGHALLNAYNAATVPPRGGRLVVTRDLQPYLHPETSSTLIDEKHLCVDWIHSNSETVDQIYTALGIDKPSSEKLEAAMMTYVDNNQHELSEDWITGTLSSNGL